MKIYLSMLFFAPILMAQSPAPIAHAGTFTCSIVGDEQKVVTLSGVLGHTTEKIPDLGYFEAKAKISSNVKEIPEQIFQAWLGSNNSHFLYAAPDRKTYINIYLQSHTSRVAKSRGAVSVMISGAGLPDRYYAGLCETQYQLGSNGEFFQ